MGCRKVICLDGFHLRGQHPRVLLCVVGIDPNNSCYPLVVATIEVENKSS